MTKYYEDENDVLDFLYDDDYLDEEELPEVHINIEGLTNRELLEELLSYADFKGYEEERFNALEDEIYRRLDKWVKVED